MTVEQNNVVDIVSLDKDSNEVILTISDHLEWDDADSHLQMLQSKINTYLAFVESGELVEKYPKAKDRQVRLEVMFMRPPNRDAEQFLNKARPVVEGAGIAFGWRLFAASYDN